MSENVFFFGKGSVSGDMSVMEFLVGMSLCRKGPLTSRGVAADVSRWFDKGLEAVDLMTPLMAIVDRGWARVDGGAFAILDTGVEAVQGFYVVMVRLLDAGRGLLDLSVLMSIVREFEGKVP